MMANMTDEVKSRYRHGNSSIDENLLSAPTKGPPGFAFRPHEYKKAKRDRSNRIQFLMFIVLGTGALLLLVLSINEVVENKSSSKRSIQKSIDACEQWRNDFPKHQTSNTSSFFNCDSEVGECKYFYPARFFNDSCGLGKDYVDLLETAKILQANGMLWCSMPEIPLPTIRMTFREGQINEITGVPFITQNISMIHVHKTGGTSLATAFTQSIRKYKFKGQRFIIYYHGQLGTTQNELRVNHTSHKLDGAVTYPDEWNLNDMLVTAIIRDPIDRFVSAVGQAMGGRGSPTRRISREYRSTCTKDTIPETLRCSIDFILERGTFWELHFTPMALELSFGTMYKNVPVALFPFESLSTYLQELGIRGDKGTKHRPATLTAMNSTHMDQDMIRDVCKIYEVDVIMMRSLGWEVPRCDKYV